MHNIITLQYLIETVLKKNDTFSSKCWTKKTRRWLSRMLSEHGFRIKSECHRAALNCPAVLQKGFLKARHPKHRLLIKYNFLSVLCIYMQIPVISEQIVAPPSEEVRSQQVETHCLMLVRWVNRRFSKGPSCWFNDVRQCSHCPWHLNPPMWSMQKLSWAPEVLLVMI